MSASWLAELDAEGARIREVVREQRERADGATFLAFCAEAAAEVRTWPAWKREAYVLDLEGAAS